MSEDPFHGGGGDSAAAAMEDDEEQGGDEAVHVGGILGPYIPTVVSLLEIP